MRLNEYISTSSLNKVEKSAMFIHNYINEFKLGSCVKRTGTLFASSMLMLISQSSIAVGVGEAQVNSYLNTPLNIQMPITGVTEDELRSLDVRLASYEQFQRLGINPQGLKRYQVKILNLNTGPTIVLTSDQPFKESYIEIAIVIRFAGGELVKAVSAFIDPAPSVQITNKINGETQYKTAIRLTASEIETPSIKQNESITQAMTKVEMAPVQIRQLKGARVWGPTQLNDSLWKVARRMRNDGIYDASLYQIMMAVFYGNQDAFYKGRIGRLKMAYMLRLPKVDAVNRLTKSQALKLFQAASRGVVTTRPAELVAINPTRPVETTRGVGSTSGISNSSSNFVVQEVRAPSNSLQAGQNFSSRGARSSSKTLVPVQSLDIKALIELQSSIQSNKNTAIELKYQNEALKFQLAEIVLRLDRIQNQLEQDVASTQQLIQELNKKGLEVSMPLTPNQPTERQLNNVAVVSTSQRKITDSVAVSNLVTDIQDAKGTEQNPEMPSGSAENLAGQDSTLTATTAVESGNVTAQQTVQDDSVSPNNNALKNVPEQVLSKDASALNSAIQSTKDSMIQSEKTADKKTSVGIYIIGLLAACVLAFLGMLAFYMVKRRQSKSKIKINPIIVGDEALISDSDGSRFEHQGQASLKTDKANQEKEQLKSEQEDDITYERKGMEFVSDNEKETESKDKTSKYRKDLPEVNRNKVQLDLIKTSAEAYLAYGRYDEAIELVDFETSQQSNNPKLTTLLQKYLVELKIRVAELQSSKEPEGSQFGENDIGIAVAAAVANAYSEEEYSLEEPDVEELELELEADYLDDGSEKEASLEDVFREDIEPKEVVDEEYEYLESMQLLDDDEYDESVFDEVDDLDVEDSNSLSKKAS
jgi:FimV-like protein